MGWVRGCSHHRYTAIIMIINIRIMDSRTFGFQILVLWYFVVKNDLEIIALLEKRGKKWRDSFRWRYFHQTSPVVVAALPRPLGSFFPLESSKSLGRYRWGAISRSHSDLIYARTNPHSQNVNKSEENTANEEKQQKPKIESWHTSITCRMYSLVVYTSSW